MKILLVLFLVFPSHKPAQHSAPMESVDECVDAVREILQRPPPPNGQMQVGCVVVANDSSGT